MIPHSRPTLGSVDVAAVGRAVASGYIGSGDRTIEFERRVAERLGRKFARATSSGSAALKLSLLGAGVKPGCSVLIPAFACRAVLNTVVEVGARPFLVDIDDADFNISVAGVEQALEQITGEPAVLLLVHSFGAPTNVKAFSHFGLTIIEDAASSFGANTQGAPVGKHGRVSVLSFGSTKMMTAGQGGMVLTDDAEVAADVERLMDYDGVTPARIDDPFPPMNCGFSDLQAALGLSQLESLGGFVSRRREIAGIFSRELEGISDIVLPASRDGGEHAYYRYIVLSGRAPEVVASLQEKGIDARGSVAHFLQDLARGDWRLPVCESVRERIVSLPIHPSLSDAEVVRIASTAGQAFRALVQQLP